MKLFVWCVPVRKPCFRNAMTETTIQSGDVMIWFNDVLKLQHVTHVRGVWCQLPHGYWSNSCCTSSIKQLLVYPFQLCDSRKQKSSLCAMLRTGFGMSSLTKSQVSRWTYLPFGISPATEIFEMLLDEVIHGLTRVARIMNVLLIWRKCEAFAEAVDDHNENLDTYAQMKDINLLQR